MLPGLSGIVARLLRCGTERCNATRFVQDIDVLGGTFSARTDPQTTAIAAEFLKRDFDAGFALLADAVLHPSLSHEEVGEAALRCADSVKTIKDNLGLTIFSYCRSFYFGAGHPYGRLAGESAYERMRREEVSDYHKRMYVGRNMTVIVAGDFDTNAAKARVAEAFGGAPAGTAYAWVEDRPPAAPNRVLLVDKPDATKTYFTIAQPGVARLTPDRVTLDLVNTLIGGRSTSLLNEALRTKRGLAYGASSHLDLDRLTGAIYVTSFVDTDYTTEAIDSALDVLKRVRRQGFTAEQLASAKAYVKGGYATSRLQTFDAIAATLGELEIFRLGRDEVDQYFQRIDAVTLEEANAAARKYYTTESLTFVLLGNAAKIRGGATRYGRVTERSVKLAGWAY
jgi:predicted Zn-dependent peptidase